MIAALIWVIIAAALLLCMTCADAPPDPLRKLGDDPKDWSSSQ